jgi:hypothetical protein
MRAAKVTVSPAETVAPELLPFTVRSTAGVTLPPPLLETVWVSTLEVLGEKLLSPKYEATIACVPTTKLDVVKLAVPETKFPEPKKVLPSRKFTVPVGTPVPATGITWAWKITCCPLVDGLLFELTVVVVLTLTAVTIWLTVAEVLPCQLPLPL